MSIIASQKLGRRFGVPLIIFWIFFQSMLFCAALLSSVMLPVASLDNGVVSDSLMQGMSVGISDHVNGHNEAPQLSHTHAMDHSGTNLSKDTCCDKQDNYLTSAAYSLFVPLILSFVLFFVVNLSSSKSKWFNYLREPPPRYNYPRNHLVNCTFLD